MQAVEKILEIGGDMLENSENRAREISNVKRPTELPSPSILDFRRPQSSEHQILRPVEVRDSPLRQPRGILTRVETLDPG